MVYYIKCFFVVMVILPCFHPSAGLPMFLQPLISACVSSRRFDFAAYIEKLIDIAKRPLPSSEEEQSDLPQVRRVSNGFVT